MEGGVGREGKGLEWVKVGVETAVGAGVTGAVRNKEKEKTTRIPALVMPEIAATRTHPFNLEA